MPEPSPDQCTVLNKVTVHSDRLFEALEALAEAGGLGVVTAGMRPQASQRLADQLRAVRQSIDEALSATKPPKRRGR